LRSTTPYRTSLDGILYHEPRATIGTPAQKMPNSARNSPRRCRSAGVQGDPSIPTANNGDTGHASELHPSTCTPQPAPCDRSQSPTVPGSTWLHVNSPRGPRRACARNRVDGRMSGDTYIKTVAGHVTGLLSPRLRSGVVVFA
jgi:hypothetical protein